MNARERGGAGWTLAALAMAAVSLFVSSRFLLPGDLSGVEGSDGASAAPPRNLTLELEKIGARGGALAISEAELNRYFAETVFGRQSGLTRLFSSFERVAFDLKEGEMEIYFQRRLLGIPNTVSLRLRVQDDLEGRVIRSAGSSIGRLRVDRFVFQFLLNSYRRFGEAFAGELALLDQMDRVILRDGAVEIRGR